MGEEVYQLSIEPDAIAEYLITGWVKQTRSNVIRYFRNRITLQTRETRPQQIVAAVDPAVAQHKPGPSFFTVTTLSGDQVQVAGTKIGPN
jgi:hypothetical protein